VKKTSTIYLLTTGGTLEKAYSEQTGSVRNLDSKVDRHLSRLRLPNNEVIVVPLGSAVSEVLPRQSKRQRN
jgi:L-asparaginase/Glu-tRNA(Gln) amidotransferase subunit D